MSQYPHTRRGGGSPNPLPLYKKTCDHGFDLPRGVSLRVRVYRPLRDRSLAPLLLLCWTLREQGHGQSISPEETAGPLRREVMRLPCRVSLVERFAHYGYQGQYTERIHKVLEVLPESAGGGAVLFAIGRTVIESLVGESLDTPDGRNAAWVAATDGAE